MTAFAIKLIAICTMILDHATHLLGNIYSLTPQTYNLLHGIGRIAFPLYAFFAVIGWKNTRNAKKYIMRMGVAAAAAQIPFMLFFQTSKLNVLFTLCLALLLLYTYDQLAVNGKNLQVWTLSAGIVLTGLCIPMDFGLWGVALVFLLYVCKSPVQTILVITGWGYCKYALFASAGWQNPAALQWTLFCALAGILAASYNGKKGYGCKWLFYAVYPVHLALLALLRYWWVR